MKKQKHTPGPWKIDELATAGGAPIITASTCWRNQPREVAKVLYAFGSEDPEVETNAHLIAKAWLIPELVKALTKITRYYMQDSGYYEDRLEHNAVKAAITAIKKAEGE